MFAADRSSWQNPRILVLLLLVFICGSLAGAWNLWLFHHLRGQYADSPVTRSFLGGLAGVLFSPGRGLLVYCPFLLFALAGIHRWRTWNRGAQVWLLSISAAYCVAHLIVVSLIATWWGGQCWGPRYLTGIMPFLTLLILPALDAVLDSNLDLTSIALDTGFASHSHFTARFRAFFGLTPEALRRAAGSGQAAKLRKIMTAQPAAAA